MNHVTIVGSGIAGIAAAVEALEQGAEVTIVRGRPGATALSSGAWDIAGCPFRFSGLQWHEHSPASSNIKEIVRRSPYHPYTLLSQNESCSNLYEFLQKGIDRLAQKYDLRIRGSMEKTFLALNPFGGVKGTSFVSHSHISGNLLEMKEARLLVVGFKGIPQFSATQMASLLQELSKRQEFSYFSKIIPVEISLNLSQPLSPLAMASKLDDDASIELIHQLLVREVENNQASHVALPPVIGIRKTDHILSRLREATGNACSWFEFLGTPPSLPGLRLQHWIDGLFEHKKIRVDYREGEAVECQIQNRQIKSLKIRTADKDEELAVNRLVLATGRYIGGGIIKEKSFREPVLNLPLFSNGRLVEEVFTGHLLTENFLGDHPLFSVGVRTNKSLQPVEDRGQLLYENLWVAGSLLGGYNPSVQHCGMGVAIGTGTLAGRLSSIV